MTSSEKTALTAEAAAIAKRVAEAPAAHQDMLKRQYAVRLEHIDARLKEDAASPAPAENPPKAG